jgi:hypothetical protein
LSESDIVKRKDDAEINGCPSHIQFCIGIGHAVFTSRNRACSQKIPKGGAKMGYCGRL